MKEVKIEISHYGVSLNVAASPNETVSKLLSNAQIHMKTIYQTQETSIEKLYNATKQTHLDPEEQLQSCIHPGDVLVGLQENDSPSASPYYHGDIPQSIHYTPSSNHRTENDLEINDIYEVTFEELKIGLTLETINDQQTIRVKDTTGPARECRQIEIGDILLDVNRESVQSKPFAHVMHTLKYSPRPLVLRFYRDSHVEIPPDFFLDRRNSFADELQSQCAVESDVDDLASVGTTHESSSGSTRTNAYDLDIPPPISFLSQWKSMDWTFGMAPNPKVPMDDYKTAMLSLNILPPEAQLSDPYQDKATLLVRWIPCQGARMYQLNISRDWPVKVWKLCTEPVEIRDGRLECLVKGLEFGRAYVFRIRCGVHPGAFGDYSDVSVPFMTETIISPSKHDARTGNQKTRTYIAAPTSLTLDYHPEFDSNINTNSLVVTWIPVLNASYYQVHYMKPNNVVALWKSTPDLSTSELIGKDGLMRYHLQGLTSSTEYVVRVRAADSSLQWGEFSEPSSSLSTMSTQEDEVYAREANARRATAIAVVSTATLGIKSMAHSVKGAVLPMLQPSKELDSGIFSQVFQRYREVTSPRHENQAFVELK